VSARAEYLERLRDLLPPRDADRVVEEVDGLVLDRMEAIQREDGTGEVEAERRAIAALGAPETLADQIVGGGVRIDVGTRRAFVRWLALLFTAHLVLAVVLTVAKADAPAVAGLLGPIPMSPAAATVTTVLSIFLIDAGLLLFAFALLGGPRATARLPRLRIRPSQSRRDAVGALLLLGLAAAVIHAPLRDAVFALRSRGRVEPILGEEVVRLVPFADVVLALFAARQVLILLGRGRSMTAVAIDALASIAAAALLVVASTSHAVVQLPHESLGPEAALLWGDLLTRILLVVLVAAALFLAVRFVQRVMLLRELALRRTRPAV
jgi:hypothetical protein